MVSAERKNKRSKHEMEEDRNRSAGPASFRVEEHREGIPNQHAREIDGTERQQDAPEPSLRSNQQTLAAGEAEADFAVENNDDDLNRQEISIRKQSGIPVTQRWQKPTPADCHQDLPQDPQYEKKQQNPEEQNGSTLVVLVPHDVSRDTSVPRVNLRRRPPEHPPPQSDPGLRW